MNRQISTPCRDLSLVKIGRIDERERETAHACGWCIACECMAVHTHSGKGLFGAFNCV